MRRLRPILFYTLLLAAVSGAIAWMLHVPPRPERAYRTAPAQAIWISRHRNLAGRWREMARNPLLRQAAGLFGADPVAVRINGTKFGLRRAEAEKILATPHPA